MGPPGWLDAVHGPAAPATTRYFEREPIHAGIHAGESIQQIAAAFNQGAVEGALVERKTGFVILLPPERHGAVEVAEQMIKPMSQLPQSLRHSVAWAGVDFEGIGVLMLIICNSDEMLAGALFSADSTVIPREDSQAWVTKALC